MRNSIPPDELQLLDSRSSDAAVVAAVAAAAAEVDQVTVDSSGVPVERRIYGYDPERGHRLIDTIDLDGYHPYPRVKTGTVQLATPEALTTYAARHVEEGRSTLWANIDGGTVTVVFDDHNDGDIPGWAEHRAILQLRRSAEWQAWEALTGKWLSQVELAEFLEEHLLEVTNPDGSTLLEVTQTFHATTGATFKSAQQLHSGERRLVYEENIEAKAGRNQHVEIPTDLTVKLRPWLGVDPVDVQGKFRFRVRDGQLGLGIKLFYLDDISRTAVEAAAAHAEKALGLPLIEGSAPQARR